MNICWQCGKRLCPTFAVIYYDGGLIRTHKVCKPNAEVTLGLRRRNIGFDYYETVKKPSKESDLR